MNTTLYFVLIALLYSTSLLQAQQQTDSEKAIRDVFTAYRNASLENKGEEFVQYTDTRTERYYTKILSLTKSADSAVVADLPFSDQLMVLLLRISVEKDTLLSFNTKGLMVYIANSGLLERITMSKGAFSLGKIVINDFFAAAELFKDSVKSPMIIHFYRENGIWKVDISSFLDSFSSFVKYVSVQSKLNNKEIMKILIEIFKDKKPNPSMWHPIQ